MVWATDCSEDRVSQVPSDLHRPLADHEGWSTSRCILALCLMLGATRNRPVFRNSLTCSNWTYHTSVRRLSKRAEQGGGMLVSGKRRTPYVGRQACGPTCSAVRRWSWASTRFHPCCRRRLFEARRHSPSADRVRRRPCALTRKAQAVAQHAPSFAGSYFGSRPGIQLLDRARSRRWSRLLRNAPAARSALLAHPLI